MEAAGATAGIGGSRPVVLWLVAIGAAMETLFAAAALAGDLRDHLPVAIPLGLVAFALQIVAIAVVRRAEESRAAWVVLVGAAVLFRATLVPVLPSLSDDVYRSLWEGKVCASGANPFAHAPLSEDLAPLRDDAWARVNHPEIPAIYPPLAQAVAALAHAAAPERLEARVAVFKAIYTLFDLAVALPLIAWLSRVRRPRLLVVVWLWSPLVVLEFAGQGHNDSIGILLAVTGGWLASRGRPIVGAVALAASALSKLLGGFLLPAALRGSSLRIHGLALCLFLALFAGAWLPFALAGGGLLGGASEYAVRWEANSPVYPALVAAAEPAARALDASGVLASTWWAPNGSVEPRRLVRTLLGMVLVALAITVRLLPTMERRCAWFLFGAIVLSPTIHPWYVAWTLPFAALAGCAPALVLSGTCLLAYARSVHAASGSPLLPETTLLVLEWLPVGAAVVASGISWRLRERPRRRDAASG